MPSPQAPLDQFGPQDVDCLREIATHLDGIMQHTEWQRQRLKLLETGTNSFRQYKLCQAGVNVIAEKAEALRLDLADLRTEYDDLVRRVYGPKR